MIALYFNLSDFKNTVKKFCILKRYLRTYIVHVPVIAPRAIILISGTHYHTLTHNINIHVIMVMDIEEEKIYIQL